MALEVSGLSSGYGPAPVLKGVDFRARAGEITCLMGRNGAGKTTLIKAIMGLLPAASGTITLNGTPLSALPPHEVPLQGIAWVPQGRRLFGPMTVAENLDLAGLPRNGRARPAVLDLFPRLRERLSQTANTLSGGEQQMLAIGRALCLEPKVILLDEPTEGLQPSMITLIRDAMLHLRATGVAVVLVEQKVESVLKLADKVAFMAQGKVQEMLPASGLTTASRQFADYVGV